MIITLIVCQSHNRPATSRRQEDYSFIFIGGLQRSGTTWLEGLVASPLVSGLSFDNVNAHDYERVQPWLLQNHTQAYFEMVTKFGGVEGKFIQVIIHSCVHAVCARHG
jgi:hypothetical protein